MALGAGRRDIVSMILRRSAGLLAAGLGAGTILALRLGRIDAPLLFGLRPSNAGVLAGAALLLAVVTLFAAYIPARRAARLEPMAALREE